jgi:hypothetical protein
VLSNDSSHSTYLTYLTLSTSLQLFVWSFKQAVETFLQYGDENEIQIYQPSDS